MSESSRRPGRFLSLGERAAQTLRAKIVEGILELGAPLSETTLADELGISRPKVREALLRLQIEGLITTIPRRGSFVFRMSSDDVRQICELRAMLEIGATHLAMDRDALTLAKHLDSIVDKMRRALRRGDAQRYKLLDQDFHMGIVEHTSNVFLRKAYEAIAFQIQALRNRLSLNALLNEQSLSEHAAIAALVRSGDTARACAQMSSHITGTAVYYVEILEREGRSDP